MNNLSNLQATMSVNKSQHGAEICVGQIKELYFLVLVHQKWVCLFIEWATMALAISSMLPQSNIFLESFWAEKKTKKKLNESYVSIYLDFHLS